MRDLHNNVKVVQVIAPQSPSATGVLAGTAVDMTGFETCEFVAQSGAQTTTGLTVVPVVSEGEATGSLAPVADADLIGAEAAANLSGTAGANSASKIGYKGNAKYATCSLAIAGAATGLYSVVAVLGGARKSPVS